MPMGLEVNVRPMDDRDIDGVVEVYGQCFKGMREPERIRRHVLSLYKAYPTWQYFIGELQPDDSQKVAGYIRWYEHGGLRQRRPDALEQPVCVLELEQIGVKNDLRGNGIGKKIARESFNQLVDYVNARGDKVKMMMVSTGTENEAQGLYRDVFGAEPVTLRELLRELMGIQDEGELIFRHESGEEKAVPLNLPTSVFPKFFRGNELYMFARVPQLRAKGFNV